MKDSPEEWPPELVFAAQAAVFTRGLMEAAALFESGESGPAITRAIDAMATWPDDRAIEVAHLFIAGVVSGSAVGAGPSRSERSYVDMLAGRIDQIIAGAELAGREVVLAGGVSRVDLVVRQGGSLLPVEVKLKARRRDVFQAREYMDLMSAPRGYLITAQIDRRDPLPVELGGVTVLHVPSSSVGAA